MTPQAQALLLRSDPLPGWHSFNLSPRMALSGGKRVVTHPSPFGQAMISATKPLTAKCVWGLRLVSFGGSSLSIGVANKMFSNNTFIGNDNQSYGCYFTAGGVVTTQSSNGGGAVATITFTTGDVVHTAYDPATYKLWWTKDNGANWYGSAAGPDDPGAGTGGFARWNEATPHFPAISCPGQGAEIVIDPDATGCTLPTGFVPYRSA